MDINQIDTKQLETFFKQSKVKYDEMLGVAKDLITASGKSNPSFQNEQSACQEYYDLLTREDKKLKLEKENFKRHVSTVEFAVKEMENNNGNIVLVEPKEGDQNKYGGTLITYYKVERDGGKIEELTEEELKQKMEELTEEELKKLTSYQVLKTPNMAKYMEGLAKDLADDSKANMSPTEFNASEFGLGGKIPTKLHKKVKVKIIRDSNGKRRIKVGNKLEVTINKKQLKKQIEKQKKEKKKPLTTHTMAPTEDEGDIFAGMDDI